MSNIIDSIQLSGVTYTLSAQTSGEGKSVEAGRGISVASGTSAYTVSFNLPISAGTGSNSIAEGNYTQATGGQSHAEGDGTMANGISSHAEGASTTASGDCSHAEGYYTQARGYNSHAEGNNAQARGNDSHAEGNQTIADGNCSHAEGYGTIISSNYSHAEGYNTSVDGSYSHAEGYLTLASGIYSHAEGSYTRAINQSEHASGQYNVSNNANNTFGNSGNTLFSVGNGTSNSARHNAFEIRQNGDIYLSSGGTDIKLQDHLGGGGNPTVELTQAEYDALVSGGTVDPTAFYIITDATPVDISNYWTSAQTNSAINAAVSGKVDTSTFNTYSGNVETALSGKQDTLVSGTNIKTINNESILGSGNIDIQGGGSSYSAGRGISIANDTISFSLPISAGTGTNSIVEGNASNEASGTNSHAEGSSTKANGEESHAEGYNTTANTAYSHAEGSKTKASGDCSHAEGSYTNANGSSSHAEGLRTIANNLAEHASGRYNNSVSASTTFGDSGNTLFSVGNGTSNNARHNAFEIRQNGDIYITSGGTDIKLQDNLGGGTVDQTIISGSTNAVAGGAVYTQLDGLKLKKITQSAYDALSPNYDANTLYVING